jgi:replicative DNA helicase
MYVHQLRDEMFSSPERKFIFAVMLDIFATTRAALTRKVFEYEVGSKIPDNEAPHYIGEWNIIEAIDTQDTPEILIEKLKEANVGRKVLQLGCDLAQLLEGGQITDAVSHLKQTAMTLSLRSEDKPTVEIKDYERRKSLILDKKANPDKYAGIKTGFKTFDEKTGGLFGGELTLIAGLTGIGKSTFVRQMERGIVTLNHNKNVLHISNEEYQEQVECKFDAGFTGIPYMDFKRATITDEDLERWENMMKNWHYGGVYVKEVPAFTDVTLVEMAYRELENKGIIIDVIVIDLLSHVKPIQKAWNEIDEAKKAASDCKEIARTLRLPVVVPAQAATVVADKQAKGKRAGQLDVYGSKGQVHVANTFLIITEQGKDDTQTDREDWERDIFWLCDVKKNRDGGRFSYRAKHHVRNGIVEEVFGKDIIAKERHETEIEGAIESEELAKQIQNALTQQDTQQPEQAQSEQAQPEQVQIVEEEPPKQMTLLERVRARGIVHPDIS